MTEEQVVATLGPEDSRVQELFGDALPVVTAFAALLTEEGVRRGLIGPREVPRLWERHLVNSAAVAQFLPAWGSLLDVGSGAGLPGVVLAAMRPDLEVVLLDPMERRTTWLTEVLETLALTNARVVRGRAEELHGTMMFSAVTARAVAPMDRLARWTLPLLGVDGVLLAMKGQQATAELEAAAETVRSLGGDTGEILEARSVSGLDGTTVVRVVRRTVTSLHATTAQPAAAAAAAPGVTPAAPGRSTGRKGRRRTGR
ncbi:16S rRNA (guanine(527)-N(7))-methyltransferase RsmG [Actinotalea sp. K2]|uniref:16S rRNA (guanine(527)-N(7))-methyltransferase RsmG n=1 Tax=Actinotalea sp. K2 TaxID=2939438 RepID=UPI00201740FE|nr:16S rRNA (guanine(527)-N(7))-methyltransferase RsmG [Actinotalea sp. K2]MCL3860753.1 16S rRNA (guanine(527)-N(7))-methyltransferase RsmG [Actinotalea sp. K2]